MKFNDMSKRQINKYYRNNDESHKFPINGKFNVTERAIRKVRRFCKEFGIDIQGYEYALSVELEISRIVNSIV